MSSRTELVAWLNDLLQINYTKVEQCGSGAAYCQILDSVYGDVPMARVKMDAKLEYEFLNNFKVLQNVFKNHGIDKPIPVQALVKCKMQDNLEFLQWIKKYWDMHFPGGEYNAAGRRKGLPGAAPGGLARSGRSPVNPPSTAPRAAVSSMAPKRPGGPKAASTLRSASGARPTNTVPEAALQALTSQVNDMKLTVDNLEKERDFYFAKLRDIEIIVVARLESNDEGMTDKERDILSQVQEILYSTEEGFEVPEDGGQAGLEFDDLQHGNEGGAHPSLEFDDEETF